VTLDPPAAMAPPVADPVKLPGSRGHVRTLAGLSGFRRLLAVRLTSQFGDGLFQAALAVSVLFNPAQQTSPLKIAVGFGVLLVPFSLVGPFAGVFLDRWSRRNILYLANVIRALVALPAAILLGLQGAGLGFFVGALVIAAINRFFLSGLAAAQPHVVPDKLLVTANATASTLGTVCYSLGLGVTVVALHTFLHTNNGGYAWLALAGACAYACAAMLARTSFRADALGPDRGLTSDGSILSEIAVVARGMLGGAKHLVQRWQVGTAMAAQASCRLLYGVLTLATLLLYSRYFYRTYDAAIGGLGQIVIVGSIGVVAAAFITPLATRTLGARNWVIAMVTLGGVALLTLALPLVPSLLVAATFLMNISSQGVKIVVDTKVQTYCDENFRGRVFSIEDTLFNVAYVLGLFIGAITLPTNGHSRTTILVIAIGYFAVAALYTCSTIAKCRR
jgi:MFS family permease